MFAITDCGTNIPAWFFPGACVYRAAGAGNLGGTLGRADRIYRSQPGPSAAALDDEASLVEVVRRAHDCQCDRCMGLHRDEFYD